MAVPIKFGTLNPQRSAEVGVIAADPRGLLCTLGKSRERGQYSRGRAEEVGEKMSCLRTAPGSLRGRAAQWAAVKEGAVTCRREWRNVWRRSQKHTAGGGKRSQTVQSRLPAVSAFVFDAYEVAKTLRLLAYDGLGNSFLTSPSSVRKLK